MFFSQKYINDILSLTNSFVIHLHAESVSVNLELQNKYNTSYEYVANDISTWKHYVNMTGEYHQLDNYLLPNGIKILVLETQTEEVLTKQLLEDYPTTKAILRKMDIEYNNLIEFYPEYETLIKGIIYPVTMDSIIEAEDGDILIFNKDLLEKQEYSLICSLEREVKRYLARWHIPEYTITDEFYVPAIIAGYTSLVVLKIINHRLSKIGTEEVHSLLMTEFFKSNLSLHNDIDILEDDVRLWLYKNLKYLIKHTGKEETLNLLINEVLKKSGLYVKELIIRNRLPVINDDTSDLSKSVYVKPINNLFYTLNADVNNIISSVANDVILFKEVNDITYDTKDLIANDERYRTKLKNDVSNPNDTIERTKIITIEYANLFNVFPAIVAETTIENWINSVYLYDRTNMKIFKDPNTKISYNLTEKEAILLTLKHMLALIGREDATLDSITLSNVPNYTFNVNNLITDSVEIIPTIENLLSDIIPYNGININKHILSIINFYNLTWVYANDEDNPAIRSDVSLLYERIRRPVVIELSDTPQTLEYLTQNIAFNYNEEYDYKISIVELVKVFTGIHIDKSMEIDSLLRKFKNMIDKLTSYTTQTLPENMYAAVSTANEDIGIFRDVNVITPIDSRFYCLELIDHRIASEANDTTDSIFVNNMSIARASYTGNRSHNMDLEVINSELFEMKVRTNAVAISREDEFNNFPHRFPAIF